IVIAAAIQHWLRWKKYNHTAWPTPEVLQRFAGLSYPFAAIFGLRSLGRVEKKGSLGLDRAWKRRSALSMRNIWSSWGRGRRRRQFTIQLIARVIARHRFNRIFVID